MTKDKLSTLVKMEIKFFMEIELHTYAKERLEKLKIPSY